MNRPGAVQLADRLAGIDAARYVRYVDAVDRFEDRWRAFVMPRIMSYRGLTRAEFAALPAFGESEAASVDAVASQGSSLWWLLAAGAVLAAYVAACRAALSRP